MVILDKAIIILQKIFDILNSGVGVGIMGFLVIVYQAHVKPQLMYGAEKSKTEAQRQSYQQSLDIADKWVKYFGSIKGVNNAERFAQAVQNTAQDLINHNISKTNEDVKVLVETAYQNAKIAGFSNSVLSDAQKDAQKAENQKVLANNPKETENVQPVTVSIKGKTYQATPNANGGYSTLIPIDEAETNSNETTTTVSQETTPKLPNDGSEK